MRVDEYCVVVEIFIFNIIGVFGNVHLLWSTARKESLQSKPGKLGHSLESFRKSYYLISKIGYICPLFCFFLIVIVSVLCDV